MEIGSFFGYFSVKVKGPVPVLPVTFSAAGLENSGRTPLTKHGTSFAASTVLSINFLSTRKNLARHEDGFPG